MQQTAFDALTPICPRCRSALTLMRAAAPPSAAIEEGVIACHGCNTRFPVVRGAPLLAPDPGAWLSENLHLLLSSGIESADVEALVGELVGSATHFNVVLQQRSSYALSHYGHLLEPEATEGGFGDLVAQALSACGAVAPGPVLDLGCATGGASFLLAARSDSPVIGVDLSWPLLSVAREALRSGEVRMPLRRLGKSYGRRVARLDVDPQRAPDFWLADALNLPFRDGSFSLVLAMNLIDCVADPARLLGEIARVLAPGAAAIIATPFDWAAHATPDALWIDGPEALAEAAARQGLVVESAFEAPWSLRLHERSFMTYRVHVAVCRPNAQV